MRKHASTFRRSLKNCLTLQDVEPHGVLIVFQFTLAVKAPYSQPFLIRHHVCDPPGTGGVLQGFRIYNNLQSFTITYNNSQYFIIVYNNLQCGPGNGDSRPLQPRALAFSKAQISEKRAACLKIDKHPGRPCLPFARGTANAQSACCVSGNDVYLTRPSAHVHPHKPRNQWPCVASTQQFNPEYQLTLLSEHHAVPSPPMWRAGG